jgi:hypothetical protein
MAVSNARSYTEAAGFCEGTGDLVSFRESGNSALGSTSRLVVESAIPCLTRKQQGVFSNLAARGEISLPETSENSVICEALELNSLCSRTGN